MPDINDSDVDVMLSKLNQAGKDSDTALAVYVKDGKVVVRFGKPVEWIALDTVQADIFIAMFSHARLKLP